MRTSETLNLAADLIEKRGWQMGDWNTNSETAPMCLEGGIIVAAGLDTGCYGVELLEVCPAARAVHAHLGHAEGRPLWEWNDGFIAETGTYVTRTQAEVIEVLRATALIESARETEFAKASA